MVRADRCVRDIQQGLYISGKQIDNVRMRDSDGYHTPTVLTASFSSVFHVVSLVPPACSPKNESADMEIVDAAWSLDRCPGKLCSKL